MARARGQDTVLLMGDESTYGTPPGGNWRRLPFRTISLGVEQGLQSDRYLSGGLGREEGDPYLDPPTVTGDITVPLEVRNIGHWLRMVFGAPVTTGSTNPWTHTFSAAATALPSRSLEKQFVGATGLNSFSVLDGVKANTLALDWTQTDQKADATIGLIGRQGTRASASAGGTPTNLAYTAFRQRVGAITRGGSNIGDLMSAKFLYDNGLEAVRPINAAGLPVGIDEGSINCTGEVMLRHDDPAIMTQAVTEASAQLVFGWTFDANWSLVITLPRVFFGRPKLGVSGPGGIEVTYPWRAVQNGTPGSTVSAVLRSPVATY